MNVVGPTSLLKVRLGIYLSCNFCHAPDIPQFLHYLRANSRPRRDTGTSAAPLVSRVDSARLTSCARQCKLWSACADRVSIARAASAPHAPIRASERRCQRDLLTRNATRLRRPDGREHPRVSRSFQPCTLQNFLPPCSPLLGPDASASPRVFRFSGLGHFLTIGVLWAYSSSIAQCTLLTLPLSRMLLFSALFQQRCSNTSTHVCCTFPACSLYPDVFIYDA